jgi:hypothetical protein
MINLYPLNDLTVRVTLKVVSPLTGQITPLTGASVTGFLATSNLPTATAADPTLSVSATEIGMGVYLVAFSGVLLTASLLATLFTTVTPYLIVQEPTDVRVYAQLAYSPSRPATTP